MIFHMARLIPEKQTRPLPANVVFTDDERTIMINQYHAHIIDRLREAAIEHGEVAVLLGELSACFPFLPNGNYTFCGDEKQRSYLEAAINASAFASLDREESGEEE